MDNQNNNLFPGQDPTLPNTAPGNYTVLQTVSGHPDLLTRFHSQRHFQAYMQEILFLKQTASHLVTQWPNPDQNLTNQEFSRNLHQFLSTYDGIHTNWGEYRITDDIKQMVREFRAIIPHLHVDPLE